MMRSAEGKLPLICGSGEVADGRVVLCKGARDSKKADGVDNIVLCGEEGGEVDSILGPWEQRPCVLSEWAPF